MTRCPAEHLGEWIELVQLARLARRGAWPVAGGTLDQTAWCLSAFRYVDRVDKELESCRSR